MDTRRPLVLLAEDDANDALLFQKALSRVRPDVPLLMLADGESAMAYFSGSGPYADRRRHPLPGLLVTDIKLPRRSGLELLEHVRVTLGLSDFPVVMLTSSGEGVDIERAREIGATAYFQKPADFEALCRIVRSIVDLGGLSIPSDREEALGQ